MEDLRAEDPKQVGPFELRARLGAGAMGQVYLGERAGGERAAVKVIYESLTADSSFRERFGRELEIARRVRASWAAAVIDADVEAARPWFATEYVDGPSLERAVADFGPIAKPATFAGWLSVALAELHAFGVVHRDIKPSNVLLAADRPKLIDFGIARVVDATRITHTGVVMGTPAFMSPEQADGQEGGSASDVFSLAAVLVFAASGHGPFGQTANPMAMLYRVLHAEPDLTAVPEPLRAALAPCLAKHPAARPTAAQLAHHLTSDPPTTTSAPLTSGDNAPPAGAPAMNPLIGIARGLPGGATVRPRPSPRPQRRRWVWGLVAGVGSLVAAVLVVPGLLPPKQLTAPTVVPIANSHWVIPTVDNTKVLVDDEGPSRWRVIDPGTGAGPSVPLPPPDPENSNAGIGFAVYAPGAGRTYFFGPLGIRIFDPATGSVGPLISKSPPGYNIDFPAISSNGQRIVWVGFTDDMLTAVDTRTGDARKLMTLPRLAGAKVVVSPDGKRAYIAGVREWGPEEAVRVVDLSTGAVTSIAIKAQDMPGESDPIISDLAISPDGKRLYGLMSSKPRNQIVVIDAAKSSVEDYLPLEGVVPASPVRSNLIISPNGRYLFTKVENDNKYNYELQVIDASGGKKRAWAPKVSYSDDLQAVSPDGRRLYAVNSSGVITFDISDFS